MTLKPKIYMFYFGECRWRLGKPWFMHLPHSFEVSAPLFRTP